MVTTDLSYSVCGQVADFLKSISKLGMSCLVDLWPQCSFFFWMKTYYQDLLAGFGHTCNQMRFLTTTLACISLHWCNISVAFLHIINVLVFKPSHHPFSLAPFPGLPTLQFLIACSFWIPQVIKKWTVGRSGNKASASSISLHGRVATPWGFAECMFHFFRTFLSDIFCYSENFRYLFLLCFSAHGIPHSLSWVSCQDLEPNILKTGSYLWGFVYQPPYSYRFWTKEVQLVAQASPVGLAIWG